MKLATIRKDDGSGVAAVAQGGSMLLDLASAARRAGVDAAPFRSMLALIDAGEAALDVARRLLDDHGDDPQLTLAYEDSALLAPLPEPRQFRDAMSFPKHIVGGPRGMQIHLARSRGDTGEADRLSAADPDPLPEVYSQVPIFYITNRFSVRGPGFQVQWPRYSKLMDYELEIAIVTKGQGSNLTAKSAKDHIFGYTIFNDFSARDRQVVEMAGRLGPAKGKSFDGGNVVGPVIATADEIPDAQALRMQARVNGETRCDSTSQGMLHSFEELLAYVSEDETVMAGEIIGSGTVGGGSGLEIVDFLKDGDQIELEIENIGILRNSVAVQAAADRTSAG